MNMTKITSSDNKLYKQFLTLLTSKGIKKHSQCLVSGEKIVNELKSKESLNLIYYKEMQTDLPQILLDKDLYDSLDILGTRSPLLVLPLPSISKWNPEDAPRGLEVLTACQDPGNLGALIRSAAAFDVRRIILLAESCHPYHTKVTKAASGANFKINLSTGPSIQDLNVDDLYCLDMQGARIEEEVFPENLLLLLGEEGQGIPSHLNTRRVTIPISENTESLNAAVAASIALYKIAQR